MGPGLLSPVLSSSEPDWRSGGEGAAARHSRFKGAVFETTGSDDERLLFAFRTPHSPLRTGHSALPCTLPPQRRIA
jgi:hypothetical protein